MVQTIKTYIKEEIIEKPSLELKSDELLLDQGILDSIGMMKLILFLEKKLDKRVPREDMTFVNFRTIDSISNYFSTR